MSKLRFPPIPAWLAILVVIAILVVLVRIIPRGDPDLERWHRQPAPAAKDRHPNWDDERMIRLQGEQDIRVRWGDIKDRPDLWVQPRGPLPDRPIE